MADKAEKTDVENWHADDKITKTPNATGQQAIYSCTQYL